MRSTWFVRLSTAAFVLAVSMAGCMTSPRDYAQVTATGAQQEFSGYVSAGGGTVEIQVLEFSSFVLCSVADEGGGTWKKFTTATVSSTPAFTDACGQPWYAWSKTIGLKNTSKHWCDFGGYAGAILRSHYRAKWNGNTLTTFAANASCNPTQQCGYDVMSQCGTSEHMSRLVCVTPATGGSCQVTW